MEFNSIFYSSKRKPYGAALSPQTHRLLYLYARFYGVETDQVVNTALESLFLSDSDFLCHIDESSAGCGND